MELPVFFVGNQTSLGLLYTHVVPNSQTGQSARNVSGFLLQMKRFSILEQKIYFVMPKSTDQNLHSVLSVNSYSTVQIAFTNIEALNVIGAVFAKIVTKFTSTIRRSHTIVYQRKSFAGGVVITVKCKLDIHIIYFLFPGSAFKNMTLTFYAQ